MGSLGWSLFAIIAVLAIAFFVLDRWANKRIKTKPPDRGAQYEQLLGRVQRGETLSPDEKNTFSLEHLRRHGFTIDQEKIAHLREPGEDQQAELYAGTVYTAETRNEVIERQIREQVKYGGDAPVDLPDGNGGRVLVLNGAVHQLDWCEPPQDPDEAA